MTHYVVSYDSGKLIEVITSEQRDELSLRIPIVELYSGSKKKCDEYYDKFCEESGYTGPIWDKIEIHD